MRLNRHRSWQAIIPRAVSRAAEHLGAQLLLGRLYAQAGQHGKSVATIKAFLAEEPGYPEALLVLGQAAEGAGMWEDAADAWRQLSEMGARGRSYVGRYATALVKLGDHYFGLKRYKDAADAFDRALVSDRAAVDAPGHQAGSRARTGGEVIARFAGSSGLGRHGLRPSMLPPGPSAGCGSGWLMGGRHGRCRGARSYTAALRLSGRVGDQRIWPPIAVDTAVTADQSIYMGATVAGRSLFVLAGSVSRATLWLRQEQRVVTAPPAEIIEAMLGVSLPPAVAGHLYRMLTRDGRPIAARLVAC
jgi:tetratricopeptide (TPR) repeat protein